MPDNPLTLAGVLDAADIDTETRADLEALYARLEGARASKVGFPDASDFDYTPLAPFFARFLLNNLGDPDADGAYPWHTKPMEREVLATVADLVRAPDGDWWGYVTCGATEGTEYALWQARRRYPDAMVYTSAAAHHATFGVIDRLGMDWVTIRTDEVGEMDYRDLAAQVDQYRAWPAVVVANVGTPMHEAVDDVRRIRAVLDDLAMSRRWVHVDAALSGLPLALMDPNQRPGTDFADGADSVIVSAHKFVGSPIPAGAVLVRASLRDQSRQATYTGAADTTLANSRSGLAVLVLWYALRRVGIDGLRRRAEQARNVAAYAHGQLVAIGWTGVHRHPHGFTVTFATPSAEGVAKWSLPDEHGRSHIVCMPGVTEEQIDNLVRDLVAARDLTADRDDAAEPAPASTVDGRRPSRGLLRGRLTGSRS